MIKILKIALSILLFLCLLNMPYGYYQLVRTFAMIVFGIMAYQAYESGKQNEMILYLGLLILFQPIIKIALGREIWNVVDVIVAIGLLTSLRSDGHNQREI